MVLGGRSGGAGDLAHDACDLCSIFFFLLLFSGGRARDARLRWAVGFRSWWVGVQDDAREDLPAGEVGGGGAGGGVLGGCGAEGL